MGDIGSNVDFGTERVKKYANLTEMLQDGFSTNDRLYKAATLIFGQNKIPPHVAIGKINYTVDTSSDDTDTTTAPTMIKESPVETLKACREADGEWYIGIYCANATDDEILSCAEYNEATTPTSIFAYTTNSDKNLNKNDNTSIFARIRAKGYRRSFGQYSTKHPDAIAAIIGWAMGAMTGTANASYTLAYKQELGVETENSSGAFPTSNVEAIKFNNGNVYINRGTYYDVFEEGTLANGTWFDELIFLDKYQNDMQLAIMDLLYQNNKITQTEVGMAMIKDAISVVCDDMRKISFLETGVWNAADILNLKRGDTLPNGYFIQSEPIENQSQADRDARKSPPFYVALKLAGAIHHVVLQIDVNR